MKKHFIPLILALMGASVVAVAKSEFEYVPDEVLVKFKPGYELAARAAVLAIGAEKIGGIPSIGVDRLSLPDGMTVMEAVFYFQRSPYVQFAEPNGIWQAHFTPNDPQFAQQYQHTKVQTPAAWDLNKGNQTIIIAILDTGVDKTHVDLAPKIVAGFDFVNNDSDAQDDQGHGTHVSGLVAAATNNGIGVAGTGFDCKIMPVKVLGAGGSGSWDGIASGITFAANNGAKVINMSLGGSAATSTVETAVNYAISKGLVVVCSAGNNGNTAPNYPGFYTPCIAVASTNSSDQKSGFSTYGSWVDVAAPGDQVLSTLLGGTYGPESGTSMAAPVTAGVVGLIWAHAPFGTTNAQVRATLENNCDNVGTFVVKGRINAFKALNSLGTFIDIPLVPTTVSVHTGTLVSGNLFSVQAVDGNMFKVNSVNMSAQGTVAATTMDFQTFENVGTANKLTFQMTGAAPRGVTGMFYLYNWNSGQFEHMQSFPMTGVTSVAQIEAPKPYAQWSNGGKVRVLYRGISPPRNRLNYALQLDRGQMTLRKKVN